jgi:hypothetical protein
MSNLPTRTIKAGITYFARVFGAGFVLGSIRVTFLVPRLGARVAVLIEMPLMFVVILVGARFITRLFALPFGAGKVNSDVRHRIANQSKGAI